MHRDFWMQHEWMSRYDIRNSLFPMENFDGWYSIVYRSLPCRLLSNHLPKMLNFIVYVMKGLWWLHIDFTLWSLDQQAVCKLRENHKTWWLVDRFLPCQQTKVSKGEYSFFITMTTVKRYFGHNDAGRHTDQDLLSSHSVCQSCSFHSFLSTAQPWKWP